MGGNEGYIEFVNSTQVTMKSRTMAQWN